MKKNNQLVNAKNYKIGSSIRGSSALAYVLNPGALSAQDWDVIGAGCRAWDQEPRLWGTSVHEMTVEAILLGAGFTIGRDPWFDLWDGVGEGETLPPADWELSDALLRVHDAARRRRAAIF